MAKKMLTLLLLMMLFTSVGFASPLTDYSSGKVAVDILFLPNIDNDSPYRAKVGSASMAESADGKSDNLSWGAAFGLGNNFALEYRQMDVATEQCKRSNDYLKIDGREINVLYKTGKNLAVFVGYHRAKFINATANWSTQSKNAFQVGLVGWTDLAPETTLFGRAGLGNDLTSYEIGLSHALSANVDLNLVYRYREAKNFDKNTIYIDDTSKGFGAGLTFKF